MSLVIDRAKVSELDAMMRRIRQNYSTADLEISLAVERAHAAMQQRIDFAVAVRTAREAIGLSQRKLAKIVGMQQNDLSRLEKFKTNPTSDTTAKLCHALGIEISFRLTGMPSADVIAASKPKLELQKIA